jgi:hypothetical protein
MPGQLQTVHAGQLDVHQQQIRDHAAQHHERFFGAGRQMHLVTFTAQHSGCEPEVHRRVIHHNDGFTCHAT